ncbi:LLM class flavin-dependent oxidoreductase [Microbacterium sp. 18062]|uniref:LLM class flavin-dependent oxidoreductase n=1 Tax=Microbacterium sp. 18062 TaxID=2681410 RepID=UPI001357D4A8|nr:LLM class flavin-dependent oxidoreductase [Microbacterium sp. 18062]
MRFNAFVMNTVSHLSPGLWRHPDDRTPDYTDLDYWIEIARIAESAYFDAVFIADVLGTYDVYGGDDREALRRGTQTPVGDPILAVSAMAAATEHVGFGITTNTEAEHPVPHARRFTTLDHLTKGRVGWNVVTGYLPSAERNMGRTTPLAHDERYDRADEYLEVAYKLWEGSWEDDAVVLDRERGVFADPDKVHHIGHHGEHFDVPGIHVSQPSPQRTPVVFQAGASPRGIAFAAGNAEAVFVAAPTAAVVADQVRRIRAAVTDAGRPADSVVIYAMATIVTAPTGEEARAKYEDYVAHSTTEGALALMSGWMGVDLSGYDLDQPLGDVQSNAVQSHLAAFQNRTASGDIWRIRDIAAWGAVGGVGPVMVGSPAEVADALQEFQETTGVDGFNCAQAIIPGTLEDIAEHVVPELQSRGVYPTSYTEGTLRHKLFGRGDRLPDSHRGSRYRVGGDLSTIDDSKRG